MTTAQTRVEKAIDTPYGGGAMWHLERITKPGTALCGRPLPEGGLTAAFDLELTECVVCAEIVKALYDLQ